VWIVAELDEPVAELGQPGIVLVAGADESFDATVVADYRTRPATPSAGTARLRSVIERDVAFTGVRVLEPFSSGGEFVVL
jgi:hypothetical protein